MALSALGALTLRNGNWDELHSYLYVGDERNLPTWWNAALLATFAVAAALAAKLVPERAESRAWALIAAVGFALSIDEATRLHERSGVLLGPLGISVPTYQWVFVGAVVAALGLAVLGRAARALPRRTRRGLALAVTLYLAAALGLEAISGYLYAQQLSVLASGVTHVEEACEMAAVILALSAVLHRLAPMQLSLAAEHSGTRDDARTPAVPKLP